MGFCGDKAVIFDDILRNNNFSLFSYCFLYKKALKQKGERLDVSPTFSSHKNHRISSSHSIHSYGERASEVYLFALNRISRYLTELMGLTVPDELHFPQAVNLKSIFLSLCRTQH